MSKKTTRATVIESLPNALYKMSLEDGSEILGYVAGKMKIHKISVVIGDTVEVELDPYKGKTTNRIVHRVR